MADVIMTTETQLHYLLLVIAVVLFPLAMATVVIQENDNIISFRSIEATFAKHVPNNGVSAHLFSGIPSDGCFPLTFSPEPPIKTSPSPFVLISRGNCSFTVKVLHAQNAGFSGAIIYNNEESSNLITMAGPSEGIHIYALFVSKSAGAELEGYSGDPKYSGDCWVLPTIDNTVWSVMIITGVALIAIVVVVVSCLLIRRHGGIRRRPHNIHRRYEQFLNMKLQVKAMPIVFFEGVANTNETEDMCTVCLEDYVEGDRLRILPCSHRFHAPCIDSWLTTQQPFCPLCRRDSRTNMAEMLASEETPLLSSSLPISELRSENAQGSVLSISLPSPDSSLPFIPLGNPLHSPSIPPPIPPSLVIHEVVNSSSPLLSRSAIPILGNSQVSDPASNSIEPCFPHDLSLNNSPINAPNSSSYISMG